MKKKTLKIKYLYYFKNSRSLPHTGIYLTALLPLSQPDNQRSGLASEGVVTAHLKPLFLQPITANSQL